MHTILVQGFHNLRFWKFRIWSLKHDIVYDWYPFEWISKISDYVGKKYTTTEIIQDSKIKFLLPGLSNDMSCDTLHIYFLMNVKWVLH